MTGEKHKIYLTPDEVIYMKKNANFLDLSSQVNESGDYFFSAEDCEVIGDFFADLLARVGFDESYNLTFEGRLVENIMEKFDVYS